MRKILFMLFAMMTVSLSAQEIIVQSFEEKPLYEFSKAEIQKDANGATCALVNIYFDEEDAVFEGSYIVGSTSVGKSYQVFLAGGASKMVVKHDDYLPISIVFADYGVNKLQSNKAYNINLISDKTSNAFNKELASEDFEDKANAGDAESQYHLGKIYYLGLDDNQDYEKAISWFTKAANQGNINAVYNLGLCFYNGQGVEQNYNVAIEYFSKAANAGHAMAQFKYACCLHLGLGDQGVNINEAIKWYECAASQGVLNAKNNVAVIYLFNDPTNYLMGTSDVKEIGFPEYYDKGLKYLLECEKAGLSETYLNLGNAYSYGIAVEKNEKKAFGYYQKAVENGLYEGYNSMGACYARGTGVKQNYKKSVECFKLAAQKGSLKGYYNLALQYNLGNGVKQDMRKAAEYYQKAAELNYAPAEVNLANMYRYGTGVKKDPQKAHDLYLKAGEDGDPMGYANLGTMYHEGEYVEKDVNKAIEYYTKAADMGNYTGLTNLAVMYQTGNGVPLDGRKAVEYYERACKVDKTGAAEYNLGTVYYFGCGSIRKDLKKAYELFSKSANANYAPAQYNLGVMYLNGEYVRKSEEIGVSYIKDAAKQKYQLAVDYMNKLNQAKMLNMLNTIGSSISVTAQ